MGIAIDIAYKIFQLKKIKYKKTVAGLSVMLTTVLSMHKNTIPLIVATQAVSTAIMIF